MVDEQRAWESAVQEAAVRGDGAALAALFAQGQVMLGPAVGEHWARVLSGLDGTAVTG